MTLKGCFLLYLLKAEVSLSWRYIQFDTCVYEQGEVGTSKQCGEPIIQDALIAIAKYFILASRSTQLPQHWQPFEVSVIYLFIEYNKLRLYKSQNSSISLCAFFMDTMIHIPQNEVVFYGFVWFHLLCC